MSRPVVLRLPALAAGVDRFDLTVHVKSMKMFEIFLLSLMSLLIGAVFLFNRRRTNRLSTSSARPRIAHKPQPDIGRRIQPKPPWVREEVIRLKALMPNQGCRKIADSFNLLHGDRRKMTVGKSFVARVVRAHPAEILRKRCELKHRRPRAIPQNTIWALDLTTVDRRPVLGVVDHGTRACLELSILPDKTTLTILRSLLNLIELFGRPKILRTDNEGMFTSSLFWLVLRMLGIRHQRTLPRAPWQNGRIERFFGTLKATLRWRPDEPLRRRDLQDFRAWYNFARPHQHLDGRTPAETWDPSISRRTDPPRFFSAWDGILTGFVR